MIKKCLHTYTRIELNKHKKYYININTELNEYKNIKQI